MRIEVVGFTQHEQVLIASIFKAVNTFEKWHPGQSQRPDCVLLDTDDEAGRMWCDRERADPSGSPIFAVGGEIRNKLHVIAHQQRPLRWGELLQALNSSLTQTCQGTPREKSYPSFTTHPFSNGIDDTASIFRKTRKRFNTVRAVLVVNPNPVGWRHITATLANSGYRVDHVSTGSGAMTLLAEHRYNCLIVETRLPDMDGFQLCKLVKKIQDERRRTRTIIVTTSPKPLDRLRSTLAGCDAFLGKPVHPDELELVLTM